MTAAATSLTPDVDFVPAPEARQAELRAYRGMIKLFGRPVAQPTATGLAAVVLVPGLISGDVSLAMLARHLRRAGHRTFRSGLGANLGCTDAMVQRLVERLEGVVAEEGRRVALVGHSRGGMLVKLAAQRRPDLVAAVIVLSAPVTGTLSVAAHVRKQLEVLFRLHRRGFHFVISADCVTGACGQRIATELASGFPAGIAYTSIYSRSDAIIDPSTCLDPAAELIETQSSHTGMGTDVAVHRLVTTALARAT
jgi:pimeloyl-ACP methyl ester carboxylesterase